MSQWRWYVWCKTVKASKKRTKVLWSYQCPQYPVVQSAVVLIFAWLELESKNKHLFISLCGDVHIYVGNFFFAVSIAWNRGRARNILKETLALYVKHQIWKAELLTIEKSTHLQKFSSKSAPGLRFLMTEKMWQAPIHFSAKKKKMIFLPNTHCSHISVWKNMQRRTFTFLS